MSALTFWREQDPSPVVAVGKIPQRAAKLLRAAQARVYRNTDRLLVGLLLAQWSAAILIALVFSPYTWIGAAGKIHLHVWAAVFLGGAIVSLPCAMGTFRPGSAATRHVIAVAQMLMGALLIHLMGGRIETHFHVFASLALLAMYRDWRVLISASVVVVLDHMIRGMYWPMSVFGVAEASRFRWLEHGAWVAMEDLFLCWACSEKLREMQANADRQAELEITHAEIECAVERRTSKLQQQALELERAGEQLRMSRVRFQTAFDSAPIGVALVGLDGRWLECNRALCESLGYTEAELRQRTFQNLTHPADLPADLAQVRMLLAGACRSYQMEKRYLHKEGGVVWTLLSASLVRDDSGRPLHFIAQVQDISDRKRDEAALRQAEETYRGLFEKSLEGIFQSTLDGRYLSANPALARIYGYDSAADLIESVQSIADQLYVDTLRRADFVRSLDDGDLVSDFESRVRRKNGEIIWVRENVRAIRDERGQIVRFEGTVQDITSRKVAEEHLRESEARMRSILDSAAEAVVTFDEQGRIDSFNPAAERIFGVSAVRVIGCRFGTLIRGEFATVGDLVGPARVLDGRRVDGTLFPFELSVSEFTIGKRRLFTGIGRDVTDRQRSELALRDAKDSAEIANRAKSEFLANMSHEIRTPMNGILGMTELALDTPLSKEQRELLSVVRNSGRALLTIINDILDFSKIEAGKLELDAVPFRLRTMLRDVLKTLQLRADENGLELICRVADDVPDTLRADSGRLRQILVNLVGNALKFTERGRVTLLVSRGTAANQLDPHSANVRFSVVDTGPGIPQDKLQSIFSAFEQVDGSITRRYGGTGLGLTISSKLVAMMGGELRVESALAQGSVFHFSMDMLCESEESPVFLEPAAKTLSVVRPLRILLAEDNAVNQLLAQRMLAKLGHQTALAQNGREAIERLASEPFDLVLMDVQMPVMGGFEATREIRQGEAASGRHIPIVAMTAHAMKGDREKCLEQGMDGYLSKPIQSAELAAALAEFSGRPAEESPWVPPLAVEAEAPGDFDRQATLRRFDGDAELLKEVTELFCRDWPRVRQSLADAVAADDLAALKQSSHRFLGSLGNFEAPAALEVAAQLDRLARSGATQGAQAVWCELDQRMARLLPLLEAGDALAVARVA